MLKMPKMPELRGKCFPDFIPVTVNTDSISFKDKSREKQRQKKLEEQRKEREENEGKKKFVKNKAWSKQKAKREKKKKVTAKRKCEEITVSIPLTASDYCSFSNGRELWDFSVVELMAVK